MFSTKKQKRDMEDDDSALADSLSDSSKNEPFTDVSATPAGHFDLYFLAATAQLTRHVAQIFGTREAVFAEFPFLQIYDERLAGREPDDLADEKANDWWEEKIVVWEKKSKTHLPLRDLREKFGLSHSSIICLMIIGLIEEDARFGLVFESLNEFSNEKRLTFGTLNGWQREEKPEDSAHSTIYKLYNLGLINFGNAENPRSEWTLQIQALLWDILRGEKRLEQADWLKFTAAEDLLPLEKLIVPDNLRDQLALLPKLLERGDIQIVIVRGAHRNSRKTILGALANSLSLNLLEATTPEIKDDERWKITNTLAVLLHAMPIVCLDIAPSETLSFPSLSPSVKAFGITLGKQGGISGAAVEKAVTLTINLPEETERREHWRDCFDESESNEIDEISERFRLSSGNIRRAAELSKSYAVLANRRKITLADVQRATRALNRQALDTLAIYLEPLRADWNYLAVRDETLSDLYQLEERCRIRENLRNYVGLGLREQIQAGVRALFNGVSGTGKTYAARLLAAALQKDIYRLDLSTVVNKYIGETEKNLARVFAFVEELDVILLLDEGDALLTQRTGVSSANARYANLETNYLLQRLESFEGILIVTTNAGDRIDSAFGRRMDTVVEFVAPDVPERRRIWQLHLSEDTDISSDFLEEVIGRCQLTGGQIRNISLHAAALALGAKKSLNAKYLEAAVRREYRKIGAVCPLRESFEQNSNNDRW
ncbi:MAG: ATP-binding protein [Acidobacteriota bacterium]|nr:ATP-binding protein [Acidobacteriota bacterium]